MRFHLLLVLALGSGLGTAPRGSAGPAPEPIAHIHSLGAKQILAAEGATQLKVVAALPETQALRQHVIQRLALSPGALSAGALPASVVERTAPRLESMLQDLWQVETVLEVFPSAAGGYGLLLAGDLGPEKLGAWRTNLEALAEAWELGPAEPQTLGDLSLLVIGGSDHPHRVYWVEAGSWGLLGVGDSGLLALREAVAKTQNAQRPWERPGQGWLVVEADLARLAGPLGLVSGKPWPRISLVETSEEENVRTTGRILWPRDLTGPLEAWQVPTNLISEPLNSFAAARGMAPLLSQWDLVRRLKVDPVPNRWFAWAQRAGSGQFSLAFPWPGVDERLGELAALAPSLLRESLRRRGLTNFEYVAQDQAVYWRGIVPVVVPKLRAVESAGQDYAELSLFPSLHRAPPPAELLQQLDRADLMYYGWEVTGPQIGKLLAVGQLAAMLGGEQQLSAERPPLRWLMPLSKHLGNTGTEVVRRSDREWTINRKSHLGLTGGELFLLARWLDSTSFPQPGLDVVPAPAPAPKAPARPQAKPPRAPRSPVPVPARSNAP